MEVVTSGDVREPEVSGPLRPMRWLWLLALASFACSSRGDAPARAPTLGATRELAPALSASGSGATARAASLGAPEASAGQAEAGPEQTLSTREGWTSAEGTANPADDPASPMHAELRQGDLAFAEDRFELASEHYERARRHAPSEPAPRIALLRVRWAKLGLATAYAEAPHHPELERLVSEADAILAEHRDYAPALLEKGRLLLVLGDAPGAFASLRRSAEIDPKDPETHSALGIAQLATGEPEKALVEFERSAKLAPDQPERLTNLGTAYMLRGRVSEAIATYKRALALRPDDARTEGDLGAAHLADNRPDQALPHLLRATTLAPDRATFMTNLGYAYQRQGQLDKAVETQRRAIALDPKLGSAWINLGNALAELRQFEQAEVALRHAETLDPTDPRPKASLRDLLELKAQQPARPR